MNHLYATLVTLDGRQFRSSFFSTLASAKQYAADHSGVIAIEWIGHGIIWNRP